MQQELNNQPSVEQAEYVTLQDAEDEIGITRVTLKKYMSKLGIEPTNFHLGNRSLYISREEQERVKRLKQNPALLDQLRSPLPQNS